MQSAAATSSAEASAPPASKRNPYVALTKPGITRLVMLTAGAGYYLGAPGAIDFARLAATLAGTGLAAGGASALNQYLERESDAHMLRTAHRPIPAGSVSPARALCFGLALAIAGVALLAIAVNTLAALVVGACLASYLLLYTPLKRVTSLATLLGAVPGALPIIAGWTAAGGPLDARAWSLFWILFVWQIPHFLALAWIYRDDYRRGGFRVLPLGDPYGYRTGRQAFIYALTLLPLSLLPTLLGLTGAVYFVGALALGILFTITGTAVMLQRRVTDARRLFLASIVYLPCLLVLMMIDVTLG